jgi:hypothetical protein
MKTKTFLFLCFFLSIGLTQLSAQPANNNGTGSVAYDQQIGWSTGVFCDGVQVDCMYGTGEAHVVDHYKDGVIQWEIINSFSGVGTSCFTSEKFTFKEVDKIWNPKQGEWDVNTHIKGDKGALYNISFVLQMDDQGNIISDVIKNATCTGNTK